MRFAKRILLSVLVCCACSSSSEEQIQEGLSKYLINRVDDPAGYEPVKVGKLKNYINYLKPAHVITYSYRIKKGGGKVLKREEFALDSNYNVLGLIPGSDYTFYIDDDGDPQSFVEYKPNSDVLFVRKFVSQNFPKTYNHMSALDWLKIERRFKGQSIDSLLSYTMENVLERPKPTRFDLDSIYLLDNRFSKSMLDTTLRLRYLMRFINSTEEYTVTDYSAFVKGVVTSEINIAWCHNYVLEHDPGGKCPKELSKFKFSLIKRPK